jgi:hypothetical protein
MDFHGQKELNVALDYLENLSKNDPDILKNKVYEAFTGISFLVMEAKIANFKKGWASQIKDKNGNTMFNNEDAEALEFIAEKYFKPIFYETKQEGGDPTLKSSSSMSMVHPTKPINPDDLSIDKTFWKIKDFFNSINKSVHNFSRELGPFRYFYEREMDFRIPIPVPIPAPPFKSLSLQGRCLYLLALLSKRFV